MKISVIGTGYVGLVSGTCIAELGHSVLCIDNNPKKIEALREGKIPIYEPGLDTLVKKNVEAGRLSFSNSIEEAVAFGEVIFIAVSTPSRPDGAADLSSVENVARSIATCMKEYRVIVDKSTVPVKTGEKVRETMSHFIADNIEFDVVSNPEFLREGSAIHDFMHPDRIVIGVSSKRAENLMREIYVSLNAPLIVTDINSAEIIKHASNSFLAMKISFINAVSRICDQCGADIQEVARGMGLDPRIGQSFLNAGLGYGGSCFPKDVSAFVKIAQNLGFEFDLLKEVQKMNQLQIEYFLKKIEDTLWVIKGKKIAVWGLSFKPNTDDVREAPILPIIERLHEEGAHIQVYDPKGMDNARQRLQDKVTYCPSSYDTLDGCDALIIATEWDEFKNPDWNKIKSKLIRPLVIDGRNMFSNAQMKDLGFQYVSIGRQSVK